MSKTFTNIDEVISIHGSPQWRLDASLIRTDLGPQLERVESNLRSLVDLQKTDITAASNRLFDQLTKSGHICFPGMS